MKITFITGIFLLIHIAIICGESSYSLSSKDTKNVKQILCGLFPKSLKNECKIDSNKMGDEQDENSSLILSHNHFVCKRIALFLGRDLDKSKTPVQLQKLFLPTCEIFADPLRRNCIKFIKKEGVKIIRKLMKKGNPKKVCRRKTFRNSIKQENSVDLKSNTNNPVECFLCKEIMRYLNTLLGKNSTKEEILAALEKVCSLLPSSKTEQCEDFIDIYANKIIDFLVDGKTPEMVCQFLLLCSSKDKIPEDTLYFLPKTSYLMKN